MRLVPIYPINTAELAGASSDGFGEDFEGRRAKKRRAARLEKRAKRLRGGGKKNKQRGGRKRQQGQASQRRHPGAQMRRPGGRSGGGGLMRRGRGGGGGGSMRRPDRQRPERQRPGRQRLEREREEWDELEDVVDADFEELPLEDDFEDDIEEAEEELLEGVAVELGRLPIPGGAVKKVLSRVQSRVRRGREQRQERRAHRGRGPALPAAPTAPTSSPGWGPVARLGPNIRIQAGNGHRAAIMPLRDGLYIVAEVSEAAVLPQTAGGEGMGAVLPTLMVNAVRSAVLRRRARRAGQYNPTPYANSAYAQPLQPLTLAGPVAALAGCRWCEDGDQ